MTGTPTSITSKKIIANLVFVAVLLFQWACVSTTVVTPLVDETIIEDVKPTLPRLAEERFGEPIEIQSEEEIYALSTEQKESFRNYYNRSMHKNKPGHVKVYEFLQDLGLEFKYANQTNNASTTLGSSSGNCMSLAMLTTALAREAGVEIKYQLVNRVPVYQEYGSVIFNAQHIRSVLYEPLLDSGEGVNISRSKAIVDYYPSPYSYTDGYVSDNGVLSMYYRNLAAEAIGKEDYNTAYWLLKKSLEVEPDNSSAINSLAVIHRRIGEEQIAEDLYKYGIKHANNKITLLQNYLVLLKSLDRTLDIARVEKELDGLDDQNPFRWLLSANDAYDKKDYRTAINFYQRAIDIAPYLHQGYFGLAKVEVQWKNWPAAKRALEIAKEKAFEIETKSIYEAKLEALSKVRFN